MMSPNHITGGGMMSPNHITGESNPIGGGGGARFPQITLKGGMMSPNQIAGVTGRPPCEQDGDMVFNMTL
jgi:hypothetical protein